MPDGYKNILITLSEDIHRAFKTKLASEGRTAKEFYITITLAYINKGKDGKKETDRPKKTG